MSTGVFGACLPIAFFKNYITLWRCITGAIGVVYQSCWLHDLLLCKSLGFPILGAIFAYGPFSYPTIGVVTFRLPEWCMLGVFLLPAFTRLGHEYRDLLSPCDRMHVCPDEASVYTLIRKSFGGMGSEPMLTPRENPLYRRLRGGSNPRRCISQDSEPNTLPTERFRPPLHGHSP